MNPRRWQLGTGVLLIILTLVASAGPRAARAQEAGDGVGVQDLIFDQSAGVMTGAISSNLPNFTGGARAAQAADDVFVVTGSSTTYWLIQSITVFGQNNSGSPTINGFSIYVYRDAGGLPGNVFASKFVTSFSNAPNYIIPYNLLLPGGPGGQRFWLSVQANVSSTGIASWSWQSSSVGGVMFESAWFDIIGNLNGGLCGPNQVWQPRRTVCTIGTQDNMAFQLNGLNNLNLPITLYLPLIYRQ
ncbi:MAG: hypothetical protein ACT4QE_15640 [Anaerolineales bacterium]